MVKLKREDEIKTGNLFMKTAPQAGLSVSVRSQNGFQIGFLQPNDGKERDWCSPDLVATKRDDGWYIKPKSLAGMLFMSVRGAES